MKINFRKISALATSTLLVGMTMGVAAAANYPMPFVQGGAADVAIVYGTGQGVSFLDGLEAGNLQTDLQRYLSGGTGGTSDSVTGEAIPLDTGSTRIYLNTSLNVAKSTLTKTDLPTVLADYTFSGNVDSKLTETIKLQSGAAAGSDNSGKVIFAKQPKSSDDPALGISLGSSQTSSPLYNLSATMSAVAFNDSNSEGQEIMLFGQKFTVASDTDGTNLVLLKEAQRFDLTNDNPSTTVTIGGATYTVEMISASDTSATIKVTDSSGASNSREVSEATSKKIQGLEIAVVNADETNLKLSATIIAGADKLTFTNGATVTQGSDNNPIDGTYVYLVGGPSALTELAVTVFRPDSSNDAILEGQSFVDPVFGSFKIDFTKMSSPLDDANRDKISVQHSGDDTETMTMTDDGGNTKTFDIAHNQSNQWFLGDNANYTIHINEMANLSENQYIAVGNEEYGHLLQVDQIYNSTGTDHTLDHVKFTDVISGEHFDSTFSSTEGSGTIDIDGKRYTVTFGGSGDNGWATLKYPTADSANADAGVYFPTMKTKGGALVALYQPTTANLTNFDGNGNDLNTLNIPDGDGYTATTLTYDNGTAGNWWTVGSTTINATTAAQCTASCYANITIGKLVYNMSVTGSNTTKLYVYDPEAATVVTTPGVIILEGKDDNSEYHGMVVSLEGNAQYMGSSQNGVGVNDVTFTSPTHYSATLQSNSDLTKDVDWFGTLVTTDATDSDQKTVTISYPSSQTYAQLYLGEVAAAITPGSSGSSGSTTSIGGVLVKDSEVSSVSTKNLIVVGGSCINTAAATLVGGAYCGDAWTTATKVGAGEFLIKGYATSTLTSKLALLVAGFNAPDTVNAATYLRTQAVDTSKAYKGTSSTSATLVTTTA